MSETRITETVHPDSGSSAPLVLLSPGSELGERYEVRQVLGIGGYGVVYAAFDRTLRRQVALKVLRPDRISESSLRRFRREVAVARESDSPHLVRIFDICEAPETVYLTMELVEGESLRARIESAGRLAVDETITIARQVLAALDALHSAGVVHRDLKPANILLSAGGEVKLADFGLARHWEREETHATVTEGLVGTFEYLSPEQALGHEVDARSDLYAFGVLLFEMLTGDVPHRRESSIGTVVAHLNAAVPDVRSLRPDVPRWLARVVARLLEKQPAHRYADAAAVLRDIERRKARFRLPQRSAVALLALLLAASVVAGAGGWQWRQRQFDRIVFDGAWGLLALDRRGEVLWRNPHLNPGANAAVVRVEAGGPPRVVGIEYGPLNLDFSSIHRMRVFDAGSGRPLREIVFQESHGVFGAMSNTFAPGSLHAIDVDHDGVDEVFVSFNHVPYWPSYTQVWLPRQNRTVPLFFASGHHNVAGSLDVDGDGIEEIILAGINNKMGWNSGVAAVRVPTGGGAAQIYPVSTGTPDRDGGENGGLNLAWYTLVPPTGLSISTHVDRERGAIVVELAGKRKLVLGRDGFPQGQPATEGQKVAKNAAYAALRVARRLEARGEFDQALAEARKAADFAAAARDPLLAEWIARVSAIIEIESGRTEAAERSFERIIARTAAGSDVAWDAAVHYHLAGDLDRAITWYRRGLSNIQESRIGRLKPEFVEGVVLALAERSRWQEALAEIDAFDDTFADTRTTSDALRAYIGWRSGKYRTMKLHAVPGTTDHQRYWLIEFSLLDSRDREAVLADISREMTASSETQAMLLALQAEILLEAGRKAEALDAARRAWDRALSDRTKLTLVRAHFDLIADRCAAVAEANGARDEAKEIRAELARFRASGASAAR